MNIPISMWQKRRGTAARTVHHLAPVTERREMPETRLQRMFKLVVAALLLQATAWAETVGVFFDGRVEPIKFAADEVRAALESLKFTVEMLPLSTLTQAYGKKKVVIALASDPTASAVLQAQMGSLPAGLGEQAYGLRTTTAPQKAYWALGGDANGAMYGGLQLAENLRFERFSGTYTLQESPAILRRGIKLNLPWDRGSVTYGRSSASGINHAIHQVWDMTFWTTWLDEMARHRYNVLSLWSNHPFTSLIKLPDYPEVAIQDVTDFDGKRKAMSIDEKIEFWRKVMAYAKARGFEFYLFNWNIWTDGASGKYRITDEKSKAATSPATIAYMRKCMSTLLETYPGLDGFGITQGEHMSENDAENSAFLAQTYGLGLADYARTNPARKFTFIHRWHLADFKEIKDNFSELFTLPNVKFEMSYKYSLAHMYSAARPQRMQETQVRALLEHHLKSWLTVRNDDFYYHNWGDPDFARAYLNGMIAKGDWFAGFYLGADGYCPTRTFFSKNRATQGQLEIQRQWYMFMLWGRLSYNPGTSDQVFRQHLALRYPNVSSEDLFRAWARASRGLPKVGDLITGTLGRDNQWWPEACQSNDGFLTAADFGKASASKGSKLASIAETASGRLAGKRSTYAVADEIEGDALEALSLVGPLRATPDTELSGAIDNIKAMSYLSIYYAHKIRGATHLQAGDRANARNALGAGYWWWRSYSDLMDKMYTGMNMARSADLPHWRYHDAAVLKEYTSNGGAGIPDRPRVNNPAVSFPAD